MSVENGEVTEPKLADSFAIMLVRSVTSKAAAKSLSFGTRYNTVDLNIAGQEGRFRYRAGNFAERIAFDTQEGCYMAIDGVDPTTAALVRDDIDEGFNARWFGYKADWDGSDGSATDNATALQKAIDLASLEFGRGFDVGGGGGGNVIIPRGTGMIGSKVIVHDGVQCIGQGTYASVPKMKATFSASDHFFELGTPGDLVAVCDSQSRGSAGDLVINGNYAGTVTAGVATFLQKRVISVYSTSDNSSLVFTVYGTDESGASISEAITGPAAGATVDTVDYFKSVTRVAVSGATAGNVAVGYADRAAFGSRLENLQLFSDLINADSGKAMVYSDKAQHTAGLYKVKIFGGNRHCAFFEKGVGGASVFTLAHVETFNKGNSSGVASNNSQIKLDYSGLLTKISDVVMGGPGAPGGGGAKGLEILGGHLIGDNIHSEGIAIGVFLSIPTANEGVVQLRNVNGDPSTDVLILIDSNVDNNTVTVSHVFGNGSTTTIRDDPGGGTLITGNILPWTTY